MTFYRTPLWLFCQAELDVAFFNPICVIVQEIGEFLLEFFAKALLRRQKLVGGLFDLNYCAWVLVCK